MINFKYREIEEQGYELNLNYSKIYLTYDYRLAKTKDGELVLQRKVIEEKNRIESEYWQTIETKLLEE